METSGREAAKLQTGAKPNLGQSCSQAADRGEAEPRAELQPNRRPGKANPLAKTAVGLDIIGRFAIFVC